MLKLRRDINQHDLKIVSLHFVKSEIFSLTWSCGSLEVVDRVSERQLQVCENNNYIILTKYLDFRLSLRFFNHSRPWALHIQIPVLNKWKIVPVSEYRALIVRFRPNFDPYLPWNSWRTHKKNSVITFTSNFTHLSSFYWLFWNYNNWSRNCDTILVIISYYVIYFFRWPGKIHQK